MRNGNEDWIFAYDTGGERVLQISGGGSGNRKWTMRDLGGQVLREWVQPQGGSPTWSRDWIYRGGAMLAAGTSDGNNGEVVDHFTLDHLGTPRLVTDWLGNRTGFHTYWPYGTEASDATQDDFDKKFTGHERDPYDPSSTADDLDYMHARFANSTTGRFLSLDPLPGKLSSPQSMNKYSYVSGRPTIATDPSGAQIIIWIIFVGGGGGSTDAHEEKGAWLGGPVGEQKNQHDTPGPDDSDPTKRKNDKPTGPGACGSDGLPDCPGIKPNSHHKCSDFRASFHVTVNFSKALQGLGLVASGQLELFPRVGDYKITAGKGFGTATVSLTGNIDLEKGQDTGQLVDSASVGDGWAGTYSESGNLFGETGFTFEAGGGVGVGGGTASSVGTTVDKGNLFQELGWFSWEPECEP